MVYKFDSRKVMKNIQESEYYSLGNIMKCNERPVGMGWVDAVWRDAVDLFQVRNEKAAARNVRAWRLEIGKATD
jgi:hypothetical protein